MTNYLSVKRRSDANQISQDKKSFIFHKIIEYVNIAVLVLCSYSVYFKHSQKSSMFLQILLIACAGIWLFSFSKKSIKTYMQQPIIVALLSLLCIGLVYFLNINSFAYVLQKIVILVILLPLYLAIFKKIGFDYLVDNFLEEFRVFLTWLCVLGLVIWSLSEVFGKIFPSIHVTYIWGSLNSGDGYFGLVFPLQEANLKNIQLYRFTLFFVEGPLANFVFLTALASELLLKLRPNWFSAFIFSLSSLLTFSTFGFILLPLIWVCWILFSSSGQRIRKKNKKMNVIILCVFGFLILLFPVLSYLIVKHKRNVISLNTHFSDFSTGLKSFLNSPIWGHGIGNYKESFVNFGGGNGQTSGLISVAAQGGLLLLILYLLPLLRLIVIGLSEKKWGWTAYSVIIIGMFLVVVIDNNPLFAVILAFCYSIPNDSKIVLNPSWGKHKLETSKVHK